MAKTNEKAAIKTIGIAATRNMKVNVLMGLLNICHIRKTRERHDRGWRKADAQAMMRFLVEIVKKTINLRIREAQNPKRTSLIHTISELNATTNIQPKRINKNHVRFENNDNAKQRLKLKIKSSFIRVLLIKRSTKTIIKKERAAAPTPTIKLETENSKVKHEMTEPSITRVNV